MRTNTSFLKAAFLCYCLFLCTCQSEPLDVAFPIPDAILLTGTIAPNPLYQEQDDDQDKYIVTSLNETTTQAAGLGVQIKANCSIFLVSCTYVFAEAQLAEMSVVGAACDGLPIPPYQIDVASERLQFLLFEPSDEFWNCWLEESREELTFRVWVRENERH